MDILKKLEADKTQIEKQFEELEAKRQESIQKTNAILQEQVLLQGEYRKVISLIEEFGEKKPS